MGKRDLVHRVIREHLYSVVVEYLILDPFVGILSGHFERPDGEASGISRDPVPDLRVLVHDIGGLHFLIKTNGGLQPVGEGGRMVGPDTPHDSTVCLFELCTPEMNFYVGILVLDLSPKAAPDSP